MLLKQQQQQKKFSKTHAIKWKLIVSKWFAENIYDEPTKLTTIFKREKKMQMIKYKQLNLFTLTFSKNEKMKI